LIRALIIPLHEDKFQAIFHQPLRDITPGQFAVIYQNNQVVAAGEII